MLELGGPPSAAGWDPAGRQAPARAGTVSDQQSSSRCGAVLEALERVVAARKGDAPEKSYTARLLAGGVPRIGAKVTEEAGELVQAAAAESAERVVAEAADLLYHTLVLLTDRDLSLAAVEAELGRRFGVSGLAEKAARSRAAGDA